MAEFLPLKSSRNPKKAENLGSNGFGRYWPFKLAKNRKKTRKLPPTEECRTKTKGPKNFTGLNSYEEFPQIKRDIPLLI